MNSFPFAIAPVVRPTLVMLALAASFGRPCSVQAAQENPADLPRFEVASVKPGETDPKVQRVMGAQVYPGGRTLLRYFTLRMLIEAAFNVQYSQLSLKDDWASKDEYIVEGKPPAAIVSRIRNYRFTNFTIEDETLRQMLQALLVDRFELQFHRETRTGEIYLLERSDKPLALQTVEALPPGSTRKGTDASWGSIGYGGGRWGIWATTMPQLATFASSFIMHVPVLDRTTLTGVYDYRQRQPDLEPRYGADQLDSFKSYLAEAGLKLERSTGPVEYLIIDHASKPTPN